MSALQQLSPDAKATVEAAVSRLGSIKAVAARIGYSRPALSLALRGSYRAGSLAPMEAAIAAKLGGDVPCPHLGRPIAPSLCRATREQPVPTHDPRELKHWQACRACPRNPAVQPADPPASQPTKGDRHAKR